MRSEIIHKKTALRHILRDLQVLRLSTQSTEQYGVHQLYADGLVGLVYYHTAGDTRFNGRKPGALFLYGQTVKPLEITYTGSVEMIAFLFQPYAIQYLFGIHAAELTGICLDFDHIDPVLTQLLVEAASNQEREMLILDYILQTEAALKYKTDLRIIQATDSIARSGGNMLLSDLHRQLYITERTFERQFLKTVGVTPVTFSQICRFNAAIRQLHSGNYISLTHVAHHAGYADQSHFIRQFKTFTSLTPTEYLQKLYVSAPQEAPCESVGFVQFSS